MKQTVLIFFVILLGSCGNQQANNNPSQNTENSNSDNFSAIVDLEEKNQFFSKDTPRSA